MDTPASVTIPVRCRPGPRHSALAGCTLDTAGQAPGPVHPGLSIADTDRMADVDRRPGRHRGSPAWTAVRWTLLAAVLAGLFGMHVLTDGDNASGHGDLAPVRAAAQSSSSTDVMTSMPRDLPTASDSGSTLNTSSVAVISAVSAAPTVPMGAGDGMAQCVLFLFTVGSAVLLALLASRWPATTGGLPAAVTTIWGELRRRGPPGPERRRIALCVTRI